MDQCLLLSNFQSQKRLYNHKCLFVHLSVCLFVHLQNPSTAWNHHPSSFTIHHSSFFIHPSSFFIHPSSFFIHLSFILRLLSFSACFEGISNKDINTTTWHSRVAFSKSYKDWILINTKSYLPLSHNNQELKRFSYELCHIIWIRRRTWGSWFFVRKHGNPYFTISKVFHLFTSLSCLILYHGIKSCGAVLKLSG